MVDGDECYEFTWVGKKGGDGSSVTADPQKRCALLKRTAATGTPRRNLYIEGDNLEVLKNFAGELSRQGQDDLY